MNKHDTTILRELAKKVNEISKLPVMAERRRLWQRHNDLEQVRPMVLVYPEGAWREIIPEADLLCLEKKARLIEYELRSRIYGFKHFCDDRPVEGTWKVYKTVHNLDVQWCQPLSWGLESQRTASDQVTGAWGFEPVIVNPGDLKKLKIPEIEYDPAASERDLLEAMDLFGDLLDVSLTGITHVSFHLMMHYTRLRGLEQVMWDMVDAPQMIHEAMAFFAEGYQEILKQCTDQNLFSLNNDDSWQGSGGVGYTKALPKEGYCSNRVRLCDLWASAEAQEMTQVSPAMYREFIYPYERRLLEPFGLSSYGCCEDLTHKLDALLAIPGMRRISISPWANVEKCAGQLQGNVIFSWKPNPVYLAERFDEERIRRYISHTLDVTRDCVLEIILKDTHTCSNQPERFDRWTRIVRQLIQEREG